MSSAPQKIAVTTAPDHVRRLAECRPVDALQELIWNSLDAGASVVSVDLKMNDAGAVREIRVKDNGSGIPRDHATAGFGSLGGSMKVSPNRPVTNRPIHGSEGKGRLRALSLGRKVRWETVYQDGNELKAYDLEIRLEDPTAVWVTEPETRKKGHAGTTVVVVDPLPKADGLASDGQAEEVFRAFAPYIRHYGGVTLYWNKETFDVASLVLGQDEAPLGSNAKLLVLYWAANVGTKSQLHICDANGLALHELALQVDTKGINLTACICSPEAPAWKESGELGHAELDSDISALIKSARTRLRDIIADKMEEKRADWIEEWKKEGTYPFSEAEQQSRAKDVERETFNAIALKMADHHRPLHAGPPESRKLTLMLVKQALESNPASLMKVLEEVLKLPPDELNQFSDLLERTSLSSLIRATRLVADRLDTIQAFDHIVFDPDWKKKLLERTQLHRLLVHESWMFGEEYSLLADDDGLEAVLQAHLQYLGENVTMGDVTDLSAVTDELRIPDLVFGRQIKRTRDSFEHLVVELKRPRLRLTHKEYTQLLEYALKVAADPRFNTQKVTWRFVLLGTELDDYVQTMAHQEGSPAGRVLSKGSVTAWVRTWADFITEAKSRYEFFRDKLAVKASAEAGLANFSARYPHIMSGRGASKKRDREAMAEMSKASHSSAPDEVSR